MTPSPYQLHERCVTRIVCYLLLLVFYFDRIRDRTIRTPAASNPRPADSVLPSISGRLGHDPASA